MMVCCSMYADTGLVTWDTPFVENVVAWCNGDGTVVHENNSKDGITVTYDGPKKYCGFYTGEIYFYRAETQLTFTSTVGDISHIEIKGVTHTGSKVFPADWTWVKGEKIDAMYVNVTLSWDGTPASSVVMNGSDETISIKDISQIVFTISDTPTAIGEIKTQPKHQQNRKLIKDGKLLIQRNGKTYNAAGIEEF